METPTAPARHPVCPCGLSDGCLLWRCGKVHSVLQQVSPSNSFKQDRIFGTYKINFIIHSLHVYILVEFLNNGIVNTPKIILIILTGATIHFCQVQVSKYNWMWKAILNLCYLQHKERRGLRLLRPWTKKRVRKQLQGWAPVAAGTCVARVLGAEMTGDPAMLPSGCEEDIEVIPARNGGRGVLLTGQELENGGHSAKMTHQPSYLRSWQVWSWQPFLLEWPLYPDP